MKAFAAVFKKHITISDDSGEVLAKPARSETDLSADDPDLTLSAHGWQRTTPWVNMDRHPWAPAAFVKRVSES